MWRTYIAEGWWHWHVICVSFDSDHMLSRLVVSLIILNICGVRLLCLWLHAVHFIINCFYRNLLQLLYSIWLYVSLVLYIHCIYI